MNTFIKLFCLLIIAGLAACQPKIITLESLLNESTNRMGQTITPVPAYKIGQFSSYDRRSTSPDEEGWFANRDYTHFIRTEEIEGRKEYVMFDAAGPGSVVRFWMTFAGEGASDGILRIYMDGASTPVIEDSVLHVISGGLLCGEPLSASVSPLSDYERRGHNLFLPLPYNTNCKITYECSAIEINEEKRKPSVYYNINYRTYEAGTVVETLTKEALSRAEEKIQLTNQLLKDSNPMPSTGKKITISENIQPGDTAIASEKSRGKAVSQLKLKLEAEDDQQALRSTVLIISFDGQQTNWVPVGEFFGTGHQYHSSKTWFTEVDEKGNLIAKFLMPFKENMQIQLVNFSDQTVQADMEIAFSAYPWKQESMYFGSSWHEYHNLFSADNEDRQSDEWHFDVNYIDITGKGLYVGDALTVFNTADAWWGEGDEKIFVDGENFPSCIGTGTEDYYGYAWCMPEAFTHPYMAQPTGKGNFYPGMTVNMRYRTLDAMPFDEQISSNIEMWHWALTKINFALTTYYYVAPGFSINIIPDEAGAQRQVAHSRADLYVAKANAKGILEGEWLKVIDKDGGETGIQSAAWYDWSDNSQLRWHHGEQGDKLELEFMVDEPGTYAITGHFTKAKNYGNFQCFINDTKAGNTFHGYKAEGINSYTHPLSTHKLHKGSNTISMKALRADKEEMPENLAGVDFIEFKKLD